MSKRFPTPEEEAEERAQGEALLRAVQEMRAREQAQREWLREQVAKGLDERDDEHRDREGE